MSAVKAKITSMHLYYSGFSYGWVDENGVQKWSTLSFSSDPSPADQALYATLPPMISAAYQTQQWVMIDDYGCDIAFDLAIQ
ncbi:hypothetical protein CYR40_07910 [Chimaeribacter arupi]|uniref:Uncharacterized protein n=1 Tax=Chimaeribacter arupi TaxID=2060066 RepID=A0A2N5ENC9_9GAMM|nr:MULTISPECIES: hypothetical protein [Yersiniaceae]PLR31406.1 hypothetical protein CYR23_16155 [Chimaeribacter arupi]PLR47522.1 hypothetical protein CYR40_07910 [Chimaeribacter arupi]PLR50191.1 hypothetical protein CYR34_09825 [Chimaeribacter arupi]PLR53669.1 hypothetical protein CYR52_05655 [Chimaeribacter arupi]WKZ94883.1 hypothetical protein P0E69_22000 [Chimaeribacter arupi]